MWAPVIPDVGGCVIATFGSWARHARQCLLDTLSHGTTNSGLGSLLQVIMAYRVLEQEYDSSHVSLGHRI